jgi:hypothetical protein
MTMHIPIYSTRNERKLPAIAIAVAVDSYVDCANNALILEHEFGVGEQLCT